MPLAERLPVWTTDRWDLPLDRALLQRLEAEAADAGIWGPGPQWTFSTEHITSLADMIHAWVGWGRLPVAAGPSEAYATTGRTDFVANVLRYLKQIDHLDLVDEAFLAHAVAHHWLAADLYSIMDVLELTAFLGSVSGPKVRILEIGGGWGRLAEMLLRLFPGKIEYVMVDAVPISLVSADAYLRRALPDAQIGSSALGDRYQPGSWDLFMAPTWHADLLGTARFDIVLNIESFQEMTEEQVQLYVGWFDQMVADNGLIYIANSRDYVMRGVWSYAASWRTLARHRTPRSWTRDNSTHVLRKEVGCFAAGNRVIDVSYDATLPTPTPSMHASSAPTVETHVAPSSVCAA
jgi:putative sugar O-methyltransferase